MTYSEFWQPLTAVYDEGEARAVAQMVMEVHFGLTMADVLCGRMGDEAELLQLQRRLLTGEPVQYVLGLAEFCGRQFHVEPGVLIPRPETEELCRWVIEVAERGKDRCTILDIGTGSGCIATTLALDLLAQPASVVAWDLSDTALLVARKNAERLGANVSFVKQDALCPPDDQACWDIIVSNPPYVCEHEKARMERNVLDYEPAEALFVPDDDPLLFYRNIGHYAARALKHGGSLLFEVNALHGNDTARLMAAMGFGHVETRTDLFGKERFVFASKI